MIGPETMRPVSAVSTGTAAFGEDGIDAALVTAGVFVLEPQLAARRAPLKTTVTIRLCILLLRCLLTNPASTTLWNRATATPDGKIHRRRGTIRCELFHGLPCLLEWRHRRLELRCGHKKRAFRERSPLWG